MPARPITLRFFAFSRIFGVTLVAERIARPSKFADQLGELVLVGAELRLEVDLDAVQIFKDRGVEVDFQPKLGADKDKLAELIGGFDGLAIRSATKVTPKIFSSRRRT